ncbi:hypothetical protein ACFSTI_21025 [Rhizorhabdus histidinilytica]
MLPIELFRISAFRACIFGSFVIGFAAFSSPFFLSLYFQQVQGLSVAETGLRLTPSSRRWPWSPPFRAGSSRASGPGGICSSGFWA